MSPLVIVNTSCTFLMRVAKQLVVHEALDITICSSFKISWFTPYTIVASTFFAGAEIMTLFAPELICPNDASFDAKNPVHSCTTSIPKSPHGRFSGFLSLNTLILSFLFMIISSLLALTPISNFPCAVSY